jgi:hypothetical protein
MAAAAASAKANMVRYMRMPYSGMSGRAMVRHM